MTTTMTMTRMNDDGVINDCSPHFHSPTTATVPVKTSYMGKDRARSTDGKPSLNSSVPLKGNANRTENLICIKGW
jgi:hypothetical protein